MSFTAGLPADWSGQLQGAIAASSFSDLQAFLFEERSTQILFPSEADVFAAFRLCPFDSVKAVILGQDPYHNEGEAHGLSFSVPAGVAIPPSLRNIFKELRDDLGSDVPAHGCLEAWARQGVLLLNAVLTVRKNKPNSHRGRGWEAVTDAAIQAVNARKERTVFVLWGAFAQKKRSLIDVERHAVIESPHPSPLSARAGFFGSKPFSRINSLLREGGRGEIDWGLI